MNIEFTGTVVKVGDYQTFSSGFTKQELIVEEEADRYPQTVAVVFVKDNIQKLDGVQEGHRVELKCNVRGNEWQGRYFTELQGWWLKNLSGGNQASKPASQNHDDLIRETEAEADSEDGIPF